MKQLEQGEGVAALMARLQQAQRAMEQLQLTSAQLR